METQQCGSAHPSASPDQNREHNEALYKLPRYRFPHTLTFLHVFTPEAEAQLIREFERAKARLHEIPLPPAGSLSSQTSSGTEDGKGGWTRFGVDLRTMGLGWAADAFGLVPAQVQETKAHDEPQAYDGGSDTESASDSESFILKHLQKNSNTQPIRKKETVFGPGIEVVHSFGGRLHAKVRTGEPDATDPQVSSYYSNRLPTLRLGEIIDSDASFVDGQVHYPSLPSLPSFAPEASLQAHPAPKLPPPETPTPAGYLPSYRPRSPNDTQFHRGSAGVNNLGAHARPLPGVSKTKAKKKKQSALDELRRQRIVSGSFGSFEANRPGRFDERKYKLLQWEQNHDEEAKGR